MSRVSAIILAILVALSPSLHAQSLKGDTGAQNMSNVKDVVPGARTLLRNEDLAALQINYNDLSGQSSVDLVVMDTSSSALSSTRTFQIGVNPLAPVNGNPVAMAGGRVFNIGNDSIVVLSATTGGWFVALTDATTQLSSTGLGSFTPSGTVSTRVLMGDFNGDGFADPLVFYANTPATNSNSEWGMSVLIAASPAGPDFRVGPELSGAKMVPLADTIVVGDFNGDGRDEIAALLNDYQTVAFYTVDPTSFQITQVSTVKLTGITTAVPVIMTPGQVALAAGKFRQCGGNGNPCPANGVTNADLVVFGQIATINNDAATYGYSVIPIAVTPGAPPLPGSGGTIPFTASVVPLPKATQEQPFFRFPNWKRAYGALAQAAPLVQWNLQTQEQLVLGIQTEAGASYILIGTFNPDDGLLDTFEWESRTEREYGEGFDWLQNLQVGNFDNRSGSTNGHDPALQIQTYESLGDYSYHINIFNITVPSTFPLRPPANPPDESGGDDWLADQVSDNSTSVFTPGTNAVNPGFMGPADMQGRSLVLGTPIIVRIPTSIQPDLVLAAPPMHVDFIAPGNAQIAYDNKFPYTIPGGATIPGCDDTQTGTACVVNLTVLPSVSSTADTPFSSSFTFTSTANNFSKRSSVTSWGISTKTSVGETSSFTDGLDSASESIKDTAATAHDQTVKTSFGSYSGTKDSLSITTGLSDYLYFSSRTTNVYYYPVLGCDTAGNPCQKTPTTPPTQTYVQFSVPDAVTYSDMDGSSQDWYQPVPEPGNILSYPATLAQLQDQYRIDDIVQALSQSACLSQGTAKGTLTSAWTSGSTTGASTGSTNTFSNEFSMSTSATAGVEDVASASATFGLDIAGSTSLSTLNQSSTALSSSEAFTVTFPAFVDVANCCSYGYTAYVYGLKSKYHPSPTPACTGSPSINCTTVNNPEGMLIDNPGTGPLYVGFYANPVTTSAACGGNTVSTSWWAGAYPTPDVGLNHPSRWNWSQKTQQVNFNYATTGPGVNVLDEPFYAMKGFFISKAPGLGSVPDGDLTMPPTAPNLMEAAPSDRLTLQARVYNFSLTPTTGTVHVRFYGQIVCSTGLLCGDSFEIGEPTIAGIPGFNASATGSPNWTLANVDFLPSSYSQTMNGGVSMVFWVVVWMQDANGALVPEMASHGLTAIPADTGVKQITDVAIETYSNNVGIYGVHQPFHITPSGTTTATQTSGSLKAITLSVSPQTLLEQRTKLNATIQGDGAEIRNVSIAYYDGDPSKKGTLVDVQRISHMDAGVDYLHRAFFTPETCGTHTLYASAWLPNSPALQASAVSNITIDSVYFVQALINSTTKANFSDSGVKTSLLAVLNTALHQFQQGQTDAANASLAAYIQQLAFASGTATDEDGASGLTGQANVILGCDQSGFNLAALPSSATVHAGMTAQYSLAITPTGGFTGSVALTCFGAPQGGSCSVSNSSVSLDGMTQQRLTLSVTTGSGSMATAGLGGTFHGGRAWRAEALLLFFTCLVTAGWIGRRRKSSALWLCLLLSVLGSAVVGCGTSGGSNATPGNYTVIVKATSGGTVQNIGFTVVVEN